MTTSSQKSTRILNKSKNENFNQSRASSHMISTAAEVPQC